MSNSTFKIGDHLIWKEKSGPDGIHLSPRIQEGYLVRLSTTEPGSFLVRSEEGRIHEVFEDQIEEKGEPIPWEEWIVFRCTYGSHAYGLATEGSDLDERGVYLAPLKWVFSLNGAPEQLEDPEGQLCFWELEKFLKLLIKSNPTALECLFSPKITKMSPIGEALLGLKDDFLSKEIFQTFGKYSETQFRKMEVSFQKKGAFNFKHAVHLLRVLMNGISLLEKGIPEIEVGNHRDKLLAVKWGKIDIREICQWKDELVDQMNVALLNSGLPPQPNVGKVNQFLISVRQKEMGNL